MKVCPYCKQYFSTKQRLISHLTKNKKCYNVDQIGAPPILLELMGFGSKKISNDENVDATNTDEMIQTGSSQTPRVTKVQKKTEFQCKHCLRYFVSEKNLTKHNSTNKCPRQKKSIKKETTEATELAEELPEEVEVTISSPKIQPKTNQLTSMNVKIDSSEDELNTVYKPKNTKKSDLLPKKIPKNKKYNQDPEDDCEKTKALEDDIKKVKFSDIKYIVKEDYTNYLTQIYGSKDSAYQFVKNCLQNKIRGDINLLYKIYFDKRESVNYPIEVVDNRGKKIYYKTPDNIILDDNGTHIKSILVDNLQNCYLRFCNHIIGCNLEDNKVLFNDYDLNDIQKHISELSDDKNKDKLLIGLIEMIKK